MTQQPTLPVAVLDSSVLIPRWSRVILQRLAARPDPAYVPVWSEWIIAETWRVLTQQWLTRGVHSGQFEEDDTPIWQTAIIAGAQYVVSHNMAADVPSSELPEASK